MTHEIWLICHSETVRICRVISQKCRRASHSTYPHHDVPKEREDSVIGRNLNRAHQGK